VSEYTAFKLHVASKGIIQLSFNLVTEPTYRTLLQNLVTELSYRMTYGCIIPGRLCINWQYM
jgi:hypothetical protein